jgi:hypothetical protein
MTLRFVGLYCFAAERSSRLGMANRESRQRGTNSAKTGPRRADQVVLPASLEAAVEDVSSAV